jgi:hypothetical protein
MQILPYSTQLKLPWRKLRKSFTICKLCWRAEVHVVDHATACMYEVKVGRRRKRPSIPALEKAAHCAICPASICIYFSLLAFRRIQIRVALSIFPAVHLTDGAPAIAKLTAGQGGLLFAIFCLRKSESPPMR